MAKFVKVPLQDLLIAQEVAGATVVGGLTLGDTSALSVGDYVHDTTGPAYATITVIVSPTEVTLSADICVLNDVVDIYSATVSGTSRTISAERFLLAEQGPAAANALGVTTINYASGGKDILTVTHAGNLLATTTVALAFETAIIEAFSNGTRPSNYSTLVMPTGTGIFTLAIA
tara:strand:- start:327 stop:848 length:522 start_codon:yes stop_codon:yes gene_type:complete